MKKRILNLLSSWENSDLETSESVSRLRKSFMRHAGSKIKRRFKNLQTLEGLINFKCLILVLFLQFFLNVMVFAQTAERSKILQDYFETYNQHQVDEIVEMVADDFRMYSVSPDTITVDINGKEDLRNWLIGYFEDLPNVSSEISEISESGNYVSFIETAHWGEGRSQSSLAVYQIQDGKISRVWYYY